MTHLKAADCRTVDAFARDIGGHSGGNQLGLLQQEASDGRLVAKGKAHSAANAAAAAANTAAVSIHVATGPLRPIDARRQRCTSSLRKCNSVEN